MKKLIVTVFAAMLAAGAMAQLPNVKVENQKGDVVNTGSLLNAKKPLVISFWSTTCKPCLMELNAVNEVIEEWKDQVDFNFIAVSIDDSRSAAKAKALASGSGWDHYTVLFDKNQDLKRAMNVNMVPHVFVLDANGKIIYNHTGYTPGSETEILKKLKSLK